MNAPLKKVVERDETHEVLECGHRIRIPEDRIGQYYSARRQCKWCRREMEGKPSQERVSK